MSDKMNKVLYILNVQNMSSSIPVPIFVRYYITSISPESVDPPEGAFQKPNKLTDFLYSENIDIIEVNCCNFDVSADFAEGHGSCNNATQNLAKY